jgi:tetratricopeptide (TPR) repeat protein
MMTALILLLAAEVASPTQLRFEACAELATSDPARALEEAAAWRIEGGGVIARQCIGLAYVSQKRWAPAVTAFEQAAREAEAGQDARATVLWVQAGNAALAGGDAAAAARFLGAALARGELTGEQLGEAHLDRGRAQAALGDQKAARADLDLALKHVPADPLGWLLSATLARRMNDLPRAQADIAEALARSADDSSVALEAGNIALAGGRPAAARTAWDAAVRLQPASPAANAASTALTRLGRQPGSD